MGPLDQFVDRADGSMLVVTVASGDELFGCLVGFHTQVSITPRRYAVCLSHENASFEAACHANELGVHLLERSNTDVASLFGGYSADDGVDKFAGHAWHRQNGGPPILHEVLAWFSGAIVERVSLGDHTAFILEPITYGSGPAGQPLRYGAVSALEAGHSVV
jgi:flavin reductase (DIM6/NTAB) family NADH-FMN oxidoreductase RutF